MLDRSRPLEVSELTGLSLGPTDSEITLPNGITVTTLTDRTIDRVSRVTVLLPGGTAEATSDAVAGLSVSQMRQGTASMTGEEISDLLDTAGAVLSSRCHINSRGLTLNSLLRNVTENVGLLTELITAPTYPAQPFATNVERRAASLEIDLRKVAVLAEREAAQLVFGSGHPRARQDTPEMIRSLTPEDMRRFNASTGSPAGLRVFVSGYRDEKILQAITDRFAAIHVDGATQKAGPVTAPPAPSAPGVYRVESADALQNAVNLNILTIRRDDSDYVDLRLAVQALGGYFGSRLMTNIREDKGYSYGISAGLLGMRECGLVKVQTECDPRYTERVIEEIGREMRRLATDPPAGDELLRLQRYVRSTLAGYLDNPLARMDYHLFGQVEGYDAQSYYAAQVKAVDSITPGRIARMAEQYLDPDKAITVVAGRD